MDPEYQRNGDRYRFLRWGQQALDQFEVVPPGAGIMHQVNLEHLARVVDYYRQGGVLPYVLDRLRSRSDGAVAAPGK